MKLIGLAGALALLAASAAVSSRAEKDVRLVGCVVKADGGYVLTNAIATPSAPAAAATSGDMHPHAALPATASRTFYWLDEDDDLEGHAGHRVEVAGEVEDIDRGQISIEREGNMIELEFKVDGEKKVTVKVPDTPAHAAAAVGTSGTVTDRERDIDVKVKKVDVKSVKLVAESCQ